MRIGYLLRPRKRDVTTSFEAIGDNSCETVLTSPVCRVAVRADRVSRVSAWM